MSHAILPPSSAHIWGAPNGCHAWVMMNQAFPETEQSEAAAAGTLAHAIAERMISANARGRSGYPVRDEYDPEMYDAAETYANDVAEIMHLTRVYGGPHLGIEQRIEIGRVHAHNFGTPDAFLYDVGAKTLYIWDFKFGFSPVEVFENWQLINYAAGILDHFKVDGLLDQSLTVVFRIVQPRAFTHSGPINEWRVTAANLRGYFNILRGNAEKALSPNAQARSGAHCRYCPGRHACETALRGAAQLYEAAGAPIPVDSSADNLAAKYTLIKRARQQLEYLETAFEAQVISHIKSGASVPGYRMEPTYGRERWAIPADEVARLGDMLGLDLRKNDVVTPKQAVKLGIDPAVITGYIEKTTTGVALVPDNARKVFSQ